METYTEGSTIFLLSVGVSASDVFFTIGNTAWSLWIILASMVVWTIFLFRKGGNRLDYEAEYEKMKQEGQDVDAALLSEEEDEY